VYLQNRETAPTETSGESPIHSPHGFRVAGSAAVAKDGRPTRVGGRWCDAWQRLQALHGLRCPRAGQKLRNHRVLIQQLHLGVHRRPRTQARRRAATDQAHGVRLAGLTLEELSGDDLTYLYDELAVRGRRRAPHPEFGHGLSPTTVRRIHTMLHKAFADASSDDRLFAMWHPFVTTRMRRSEVATLLWRNVALETGLLSVTRAAVEVRGKVDERELTKSSSSRRAIELAEQDVSVLRQHRKAQLEEQIALHGSWQDVERVFTSPTGDPLHPPNITRAFHLLTNRAGLQRIRLHDLRHTFATLKFR